MLAAMWGFLFLIIVTVNGLDNWLRRCEMNRMTKRGLAAAEELKRKKELMERQREQKLRALQLADVDSMGGLDFEHYVCRLLIHQGFVAWVTTSSHDRGVDIVAERNGQKTAVQVKRQRKHVSRPAVSDVVAGRHHYGCERTMVVTNAYFSREAEGLAQKTCCELIDRELLAEWILDYQGKNPTNDEQPVEANEFALAGAGELFLSDAD